MKFICRLLYLPTYIVEKETSVPLTGITHIIFYTYMRAT